VAFVAGAGVGATTGAGVGSAAGVEVGSGTSLAGAGVEAATAVQQYDK